MTRDNLPEPTHGSSPAEKFTMGMFGFMQEITDQTDTLEEIAADVAFMRILIVNVCFVGRRYDNNGWVLIDTGIPDSAASIKAAAAQRFGPGAKPAAIILTHGHFDHVGAISDLLKDWEVPVYAHKFELPYLTGQTDYLPPDPSVSEGLMAKLSPLYPHNGIDLGNRVIALPEDGSIPYMPGWRAIFTPGHTKGHISLFRNTDRVLIAGDAFTTVKQESAVAVLSQQKEVNGPPQYFTTDWQAAWRSVRKLEALNPSVVITGHGQPIAGDKLANELEQLAEEFDRQAIPPQGRYVH